jgi:hypothetical protein
MTQRQHDPDENNLDGPLIIARLSRQRIPRSDQARMMRILSSLGVVALCYIPLTAHANLHTQAQVRPYGMRDVTMALTGQQVLCILFGYQDMGRQAKAMHLQSVDDLPPPSDPQPE